MNKEKEYKIKDLETLMNDTYGFFAQWENASQEEAFHEYLGYFQQYILLTHEKEGINNE